MSKGYLEVCGVEEDWDSSNEEGGNLMDEKGAPEINEWRPGEGLDYPPRGDQTLISLDELITNGDNPTPP